MRTLARLVSIVTSVIISTQVTSLGAPFFVDLQPVANSSLGDDGIANNGKGGWTDEGINDMLIYPPIPAGPFTRNGYHFQTIDPAKNNGQSVIHPSLSRCRTSRRTTSIFCRTRQGSPRL